LKVWEEPFVTLWFPKLFNLRSDPFGRADRESIDYPKWRIEHLFVLATAQEYIAQWLKTFKDFPPRQKPASFNLDMIMEKLKEGVKN